MLELHKNCIYCGSPFIIRVENKDYAAWKNGVLIQDAFPYLTKGDRELIKTGICDYCWDNMFEEQFYDGEF